MAIEKIIHCCWFGNKSMPADQEEYVRNWKRIMPDYEVRLWKDEDFKAYLGDSLFVKECLKQNKPGFLSDYFRFTVLYKFGGIYIDTDVEMFKSLQDFENYSMFLGYFIDNELGTALIGAEKGNPVIKKLLEQLLSDFEKTRSLTVSNRWVSQFFIDNFDDFRLTGKKQILKGNIAVMPKDYFERFSLNPQNGGAYTEHHCYGSWYGRKENKFKEFLKKVLGRKIISYLGHKKAVRKSYFYEQYKKDLKR